MKFLPEDKKKKYWLIGILAVSVIGVVYINFFMGTSSVSPDVQDADKIIFEAEDDSINETFSESDNSAADTTGSSSAKLPELRPPGSGPLPYGPDIAEGMLEDDRFEALKKAPELEVTEEELGKDNLFNF